MKNVTLILSPPSSHVEELVQILHPAEVIRVAEVRIPLPAELAIVFCQMLYQLDTCQSATISMPLSCASTVDSPFAISQSCPSRQYSLKFRQRCAPTCQSDMMPKAKPIATLKTHRSIVNARGVQKFH